MVLTRKVEPFGLSLALLALAYLGFTMEMCSATSSMGSRYVSGEEPFLNRGPFGYPVSGM
jgi:hypothetical protein